MSDREDTIKQAQEFKEFRICDPKEEGSLTVPATQIVQLMEIKDALLKIVEEKSVVKS